MKGETDRGAVDLDQVLRLKPDDVETLVLKAEILQDGKRWDAAIEIATYAVKLDPRNGRGHFILGRSYLGKKDCDTAIQEFTEADRLEPRHLQNLFGRSRAFEAEGDNESAIADLRELVMRFPRSAEASNALAWFLATCPDASYRNGAESIKYAEAAGEISQWNNPHYLDTLAMAYAEVGDFDRAVRCMAQAISKLGEDDADRNEFEKDLALFRQRKPYRHPSLNKN